MKLIYLIDLPSASVYRLDGDYNFTPTNKAVIGDSLIVDYFRIENYLKRVDGVDDISNQNVLRLLRVAALSSMYDKFSLQLVYDLYTDTNVDEIIKMVSEYEKETNGVGSVVRFNNLSYAIPPSETVRGSFCKVAPNYESFIAGAPTTIMYNNTIAIPRRHFNSEYERDITRYLYKCNSSSRLTDSFKGDYLALPFVPDKAPVECSFLESLGGSKKYKEIFCSIEGCSIDKIDGAFVTNDIIKEYTVETTNKDESTYTIKCFLRENNPRIARELASRYSFASSFGLVETALKDRFNIDDVSSSDVEKQREFALHVVKERLYLSNTKEEVTEFLKGIPDFLDTVLILTLAEASGLNLSYPYGGEYLVDDYGNGYKVPVMVVNYIKEKYKGASSEVYKLLAPYFVKKVGVDSSKCNPYEIVIVTNNSGSHFITRNILGKLLGKVPKDFYDSRVFNYPELEIKSILVKFTKFKFNMESSTLEELLGIFAYNIGEDLELIRKGSKAIDLRGIPVKFPWRIDHDLLALL